MPRVGKRRKFEEQIETLFTSKLLGLPAEATPEEILALITEYIINCELIKERRYTFDRNFIPRGINWQHIGLNNLSGDRFRQQLRVKEYTFNHLETLIKGHVVFQDEKQSPVRLQLAVALFRFGRCGNGASLQDVGSKFAISEGSVHKFTDRVIAALCDLAHLYIKWPREHEARDISDRLNQVGFPGCVGLVDGSHASFSDKPVDCHEDYFSRKQRYGMQFQLVVDDRKKILHLYTGMPSSVHDSTVFKRSGVEKLIPACSYILGDSAYANSDKVVTPFRKRASGQSRKEKTFNYQLSKVRVSVEHAMGILKSRFQSLKELRVRVDKLTGHKKVCQWIIACCVLHNIIHTNDPWTEFDTDTADQDDELAELIRDRAQGRRTELMEIVWQRKINGCF